MRQRPIGSTAMIPARQEAGGWTAVVALTVAACMCAFAAWVDVGSGNASPAPASLSISIAKPHPGRHADAPAIPRDAVTETERGSEDVEPDGASTYSWPAGIPSRGFSPSVLGDSSAHDASDLFRDSVDLTVLCRLLI